MYIFATVLWFTFVEELFNLIYSFADASVVFKVRIK